jgi:hypothetical protein
MRAVVRNVTAYNTSTTSIGSFNLLIASVHVVGQYLQALVNSGNQHLYVADLRQVAEAGERIEFFPSPNVEGIVSGYLFTI